MQKQKAVNRAFRRGFSFGFTAPFLVFQPRKHAYPAPRVTDYEAWRDVGDLLNQSYYSIGKEVVEAASKARKDRQPA